MTVVAGGVRVRPSVFFGTGRRAGRLAAVVIDLAIAYVAWQVLSATGALPKRYFPTANEVLQRLGDIVPTTAFWNVLGSTMQSWALGLAISMVVAIPLGVALGANERAYRFCQVVIEALRPIPPVVLIPIALLVFGTTLQMKLVLVLQATFWVLLLQAIYGIRAVDPLALQTARSLRLGGLREFICVRLPGALPLVVTGVRIAATFALISSVVAELVGGAPGLGNDILKAMSNGDEPTMYALILVTGLLGILVNSAARFLERRLLFWHPSQREGAA
jgi:ABC-type nitrate/sulfonate/bicarbonate transport system permease component